MLKSLAFAFLFFPLTRLLFFVFNLDYFNNCDYIEILTAFLYGLRFDFSTLLIVNAFYIIFSVIPFRKRWYRFFLKIVYTVSNMFFLGVNVVDVEFFKFIGKKITVNIFEMSSDIGDQAFQLAGNYWYLALIILAIGHLLFHNSPEYKEGFMEKNISPFKTLPFGFVLIVITFIGIRGGLQMRSISPKQAYIFDKYELGNLALNSSYTLIRSLEAKKITTIKHFKNDLEAKTFIQSVRSFDHNLKDSSKSNVMIIILESFSQEYFDKGYMPFLKELSQKSLSFKESYANGRRSIEALPSIFVGLPSLIGSPIYQSQYQTNRFISLPQTLKDQGYSTSFFHGGKRGTMDFDAYTSSIGIDYYFAKEDYPDSNHFDGTWGIYDHHFYKYMVQSLNKLPKPFFSSVFSLSSHQPYSIPTEFKNKFPKGNLEIHESIGYADFSLRLLFDELKKQEWFKNTLFVITADHTQKLETPKYNSLLGRYRVPLIFYSPSMNLSTFANSKTVQHADIFPSIVDYVGIIPNEKLLFGSSVFNNDVGAAINMASGQFTFLRGSSLLTYSAEVFKSYSVDSELKLIPNDMNNDLLKTFKAYIQYNTNGLKFNNIYKTLGDSASR